MANPLFCTTTTSLRACRERRAHIVPAYLDVELFNLHALGIRIRPNPKHAQVLVRRRPGTPTRGAMGYGDCGPGGLQGTNQEQRHPVCGGVRDVGDDDALAKTGTGHERNR